MLCLKYTATSHFNAMANKTNFSQTSNLKQGPTIVKFIPVPKQSKSSEMKEVSEFEKSTSEKVHNLLQTAQSKMKSFSINKGSLNKSNQAACAFKFKIATATNNLVSVAPNPSIPASNGNSVSVNPNTNVSKASLPIDDENTVVSKVKVSSPVDSGINVLSVEKPAKTDSSIDSPKECLDHGSKVVVQKMSNVSCDEVDFLEDCFNINEILEKQNGEKKWSPEKVVCSNEQEDMSPRTEKPSDICQKENLPSKVLLQRKMRTNHEMNFHIRPGKGMKLHDIPYFVNNLNTAPKSFLRFLHKVLFGTYGVCNNAAALSQTKQNILHFSGFPFSSDSAHFQMKQKCLIKVPYLMLNHMCRILLDSSPRSRKDSVEDILRFLLKPTNNSLLKQKIKAEQEEKERYEESDLVQLNKHGVDGRGPIVLIPKLNDSFVKDLLQKMDHASNSNTTNKLNEMDVAISDQVSSNQKTQLKDFPEVVAQVSKARRRIINVLHTLLYGRPGSEDVHRSNILEFSGYTRKDENTYKRKMGILSKLKIDEVDQLCRIFSLKIKNLSLVKKVTKFLHHLRASTLALKTKKKTELPSKDIKIVPKKMKKHTERKPISVVPPIKKLKDIERIRRNVECATPEDLTELNDLLYLRPCDTLEIHQKILEFSSSSFLQNSDDFHSRRTLLHYMSFDIIRKMASLLEITDWEEYTIPQDLANTLLRFLMDMKPSVKVRQRIKRPPPKFGRKLTKSFKHQSHLMQMQRDDSWKETSKSNLNTTSAMHNSTHSKEGFHEEMISEDTSVVVRRISESSYSFTDSRTNDPVTVSNSNSDESLTLHDFIQHPSDKQLEVAIRELVFTNKWTSTMGDLINKVFHFYPKLNLTYRVDFIKAKALEVLHEICDAKSSEDGNDEHIC